MIVAIINFIILVAACFLMAWTYTISIQPVQRSQKRGEKAWKECKNYRSIGGLGELIAVINLILWIWFPLPVVGEWMISSNIWVGIIIGICMLIPCLIIMIKGIIDAGSETLTPSKDSKMYGGIYNYIRHPQTVGEFPTFVALSFALNSWFLVLFTALFIIIYIPIMIHYEEKDLALRFGEKYLEYKKRTGALFPKIRKSNT